jgi:hypothetical protein
MEFSDDAEKTFGKAMSYLLVIIDTNHRWDFSASILFFYCVKGMLSYAKGSPNSGKFVAL